MSRLTLIFAVLIIIGAAIQLRVNGQTPEAELEAISAEEESYTRGASASARATAQSSVQARPYPAPPGPYPVQPRPGPPAPGIPKPVECYVCTGCPNVRNASTKLCPYSSDPRKNGKCIVYSENYFHMKTPWIVRGCASERGSCADVRDALAHQSDLVTLGFCRECERDKCNSAGHSTPDLLAALITLVITPLLIKHTLS